MISVFDPAAVQALIAAVERLAVGGTLRRGEAVERFGQRSCQLFHLVKIIPAKQVGVPEPTVRQALLQ